MHKKVEPTLVLLSLSKSETSWSAGKGKNFGASLTSDFVAVRDIELSSVLSVSSHELL